MQVIKVHSEIWKCAVIYFKQVAYFIGRAHLPCGAHYLEQHSWSWKVIRKKAHTIPLFWGLSSFFLCIFSFSLCRLAGSLGLFVRGADMSALGLAFGFKNPKETLLPNGQLYLKFKNKL